MNIVVLSARILLLSPLQTSQRNDQLRCFARLLQFCVLAPRALYVVLNLHRVHRRLTNPLLVSEIGPFIGSVLWGPAWFYNELVPPTGPPPTYLDPRAEIGIWQLTICSYYPFWFGHNLVN